MLSKTKRRVYDILNPAEDGDKISKFIDVFIMLLIVFNLIAVIISTIKVIEIKFQDFFYYFG
jgi:hypothetical protein